MELTNLSLRLILLFFPGVVCAILFNTLTEHEDERFSWFMVQAFVLGLGSYLILAGLTSALSLVDSGHGYSVGFFETVTTEEPAISWAEVLQATGVAVVLAVSLTVAYTYKLLHRVARWLRITRQSGELDTWAFTFNSPDVEWVVIRDRENDLVFEGWVEGFSNSSRKPELLLQDVQVYENESGDELYQVPAVYFAWETRDLEVHLRVGESESSNTTEEEKNV